MSQFLDYKSFLMDAGTTPTSFQAELKTHLTAVGWRVTAESLTSPLFTEYIPPVTETIGNTQGRELVRLGFTSTTIVLSSYLSATYNEKSIYHLANMGSIFYYPQFTFKVNAESITIPIPSQGNYDETRLASFFVALQAYQDTNTTSELNKFVISLAGAVGAKYIVLTSKLGKEIVSDFSSGNPAAIARGYTANSVSESLRGNATLSVDYAIGFVYFLGVHARSFILGAKTTTSFSGPIFAAWGDNSLAVQQTPRGLIPVELVTGSLETPQSQKFITHSFGYIDKTGGQTYAIEAISGDWRKGALINIITTPDGQNRLNAVGLSTGGFYNLDLALESEFPDISAYSVTGGTVTQDYVASWMVPSIFTSDLYGFFKVTTNESTALARILDKKITITNTELGNAGIAVVVTDTAGFPTTGTVIIGSEVISYTGKTANGLTGLTRNRYGTVAQTHPIGTEGFLAQWFVKLNGAAIFTGDTRA